MSDGCCCTPRANRPAGAILQLDKGVLFISVQLPEGASLQRSDAALKKVERIVAETKGVRCRTARCYREKFPKALLNFVICLYPGVLYHRSRRRKNIVNV